VAQVKISINELTTSDFDKDLFDKFCQKYNKELGKYASYLQANEWSIMDEDISTINDYDPGSVDYDKVNFLLRFISGWSSKKDKDFHQDRPSISTGYSALNDSFYKDLLEVSKGIVLSFTAVVIGSGNGYYNCAYRLKEDGWCGYCDYYDNEEEVSDEEIIEERIDYKNWDWDLLRNHKKLDLSNSDFNFLPKNLLKLNDLENLDLNWCRSLENLNGLSNLKNLNSIDLGYCSSLTDVSDLAQLNDLNYLNLKSANKVEPKPTTDEMTSREEVLLYQETIRIFSGTIETVPAWDTQTQSWVYIQPSLMNEDRYDTTPPEQLLKVMPELANSPSRSD